MSRIFVNEECFHDDRVCGILEDTGCIGALCGTDYQVLEVSWGGLVHYFRLCGVEAQVVADGGQF